MKRYSLRPDVQLECVYVYRVHLYFRLYALNIVNAERVSKHPNSQNIDHTHSA